MTCHCRATVTPTFADVKKVTENVPISAHVIIVRAVIENVYYSSSYLSL